MSKQDIITTAIEQESPTALLSTLQRLPDRRRFSHVRDLWDHLPDVPFGD